MRRLVPILLFVVLGACACTTGPDADAQAAKDTIIRYNQLLAQGYASMNMRPLQRVATADQASKEYRYMAALGEAHIRMEPTLRSIEFSRVTFSGRDEASVVTKEMWDYTHVDSRNRTAVTVQRNVPYTLKYDLKMGKDQWHVATVTAVEAK